MSPGCCVPATHHHTRRYLCVKSIRNRESAEEGCEHSCPLTPAAKASLAALRQALPWQVAFILKQAAGIVERRTRQVQSSNSSPKSTAQRGKQAAHFIFDLVRAGDGLGNLAANQLAIPLAQSMN